MPPVATGDPTDARTHRRPKAPRLGFLMAATLLACAAAGCGQRGPLKLPDRTPGQLAAAPSPPTTAPTPTEAPKP